MSTIKAVKAVKAVKVKAVKVDDIQTVDYKAIQQAFIDACEFRKAQPENTKCKTIISDLNEIKSARFAVQLEHVIKNGFTSPESLVTLANAIKTGTKGSENYVALKVITKIRDCIYALATKQKSELDPYTNSILFNLTKNETLTNKSGLMSLTKTVVYSETEQVQNVRALLNVSENTATTQLSSSRQMLRFLDICNVIKAKKNDAISFKQNDKAQAIIAFYK
jgi:hypothetical protein